MFKSVSIFLFLIVQATFSFAQGVDTSHQNYTAFYYENGQISSEGVMIDGKPDAYWITYYPSGIKKSEGNRLNFLLQGSWKFYDEKGRITTEINYNQNLKSGLLTVFDTLGHTIKESFFVNDTLEGISYSYYSTVKKRVKESIPFVKGLEDGVGYKYAQDGRIVSIINYSKGFISSREDINEIDENGLRQGIWKEFYPNGRLKVEKRYKDNLLNGYFKSYSPTGKLDSAVLYLNGEIQENEKNVVDFNIETEYFYDGTIKKQVTYNASGKKDGLSTEFDTEGNVIATEFYRNGILLSKGIVDNKGLKQGSWEEYYINGMIKSKGEYTDSKKIGEWSFYYISGELEQTGFFNKNGEYTAEWKWYYPNGNLLRKEEYRRGKEDGMSEEYDINGNLISKGEYLEGEKVGEWHYHLNDHLSVGKYRYGEKDGIWRETYLNGNLSFEGSFNEGIPQGKHVYYYPNALVKREENYRYGEKHGKWKWYDENGILSLTVSYRDGKEVKIDGSKVKYTDK